MSKEYGMHVIEKNKIKECSGLLKNFSAHRVTYNSLASNLHRPGFKTAIKLI
jgi:hypothetical protein